MIETIKKKRIKTLDIVKFISSILIVCHHFQQVTKIRFARINFYGGNFNFGYLVELFFIISGFLCIYNFNVTFTFKEYYLKKIKRILPFCIITVICYFIFEIASYLVFGSPIKTDGLGIWTLFSSCTLIFSQGFTKLNGLGINNPLWYCGVLMLCYILFYLVNMVKKKNGNRIYIYIFIVTLFLGFKSLQIEIPFVNTSICRGFISFFIGVVLYYIKDCIDNKYKKKRVYFSLLFVLVFAILLGIINYYVFYDNLYEILVFILYPIVVLLLIRLDEKVNIGKTSNLGDISFYIYIWHSPLLVILQMLNKANIITKHNIITMLIFVIVVVLFSICFFHFCVPRINKCIKKIEDFYLL